MPDGLPKTLRNNFKISVSEGKSKSESSGNDCANGSRIRGFSHYDAGEADQLAAIGGPAAAVHSGAI